MNIQQLIFNLNGEAVTNRLSKTRNVTPEFAKVYGLSDLSPEIADTLRDTAGIDLDYWFYYHAIETMRETIKSFCIEILPVDGIFIVASDDNPILNCLFLRELVTEELPSYCQPVTMLHPVFDEEGKFSYYMEIS